jgi:3-hydroxyisobutyrate dehydrogenase
MRVAVLGTGVMGAAMARNLARAGHEVRAWNRTRERAEPLSADGVAVCDGPVEAARGADVLITMLSDGDAVAAVAEPLLPVVGAGPVWWQASTVGVAATDALAALAAETGTALIDGPVLGTKGPAEEGALVVLASGPSAARQRCAAVFEPVAARVVDLGERIGAGTRMKLVLNNWLLALTEGLAESILLAERLDVDPRTFLEIIDGGPMGPPYAKLKGMPMIERDYPTSFALSLARKDALLVAEAAETAGLDLPLPRLVAERMGAAEAAGHGDEDMAATVEAGR